MCYKENVAFETRCHRPRHLGRRVRRDVNPRSGVPSQHLNAYSTSIGGGYESTILRDHDWDDGNTFNYDEII